MAFPTHPVSFLDLIICIFRLQIYVFLLGSPFGFFSFPFLFYHHSSFSIAELQCILKLGSYLFLILLFLDSSVFPDDDFLFFFFFPPHILVNHFLPLDSSQFLLCGNTPASRIFLRTSLVFLIPWRGGSTPYSTFPWNRGQKSKQGGKGSQRDLFFLNAYPESVALSTFQKCGEWDDKHSLYRASFLLHLPVELLF